MKSFDDVGRIQDVKVIHREAVAELLMSLKPITKDNAPETLLSDVDSLNEARVKYCSVILACLDHTCTLDFFPMFFRHVVRGGDPATMQYKSFLIPEIVQSVLNDIHTDIVPRLELNFRVHQELYTRLIDEITIVDK